MNVSIESYGPFTVVTPDITHLDAGLSKDLHRDLIDRLPAGGLVILDLSAVRFIDSSGCGAILTCARRVNSTGQGPGDLKICGATKQVRLVFEMVRIHKVLDIYNTRDEAIRAFEAETATTVLAGS